MQKLLLLICLTTAAAALAILLQCQTATAAKAEAAVNLNVLYQSDQKAASAEANSTISQEILKDITYLNTCLAELANMTALQQEIAKARPLGELDTVFSKYCERTPQAKKCLSVFNAKIEPLLNAKQQPKYAELIRKFSRLMELTCTRDGDYIALFVAEEGPECFEANRVAIKACLNSSFHEFLHKDIKVFSLLDLPELMLDPSNCVELESFESCIINHLELCRETTPANMAGAVFKFIKSEIKCNLYAHEPNKLLRAGAGNSGATAITASVLKLILSGYCFLCLVYVNCDKKILRI